MSRLIKVGLYFFVSQILTAYPKCIPPPYRTGATFADSESVLVRSISVPRRDFHPSGLVCLGASIKARYPHYRNITFHIFFSREAAERALYSQEANREDMETFSQLHARYTYDADEGEEYVEIMPTGVGPGPRLDPGPGSTRIDLPNAAPRCRLEINGRCLLATDKISYPKETLSVKASGTVGLTGIITPAGKLTSIRIVRAESTEKQEEAVLSDAAVQNLSSWQFETAPHADRVDITYSFVIDDSLPYEGQSQVEWALPAGVKVRGRPLP